MTKNFQSSKFKVDIFMTCNFWLQLRGLKGKLGEDDIETNHSFKKAANSLSSPKNFLDKCNNSNEFGATYKTHEGYKKHHLSSETGLSDSDSSGILNEDSNNLNVQPPVSKLSSSTNFNGLGQSAFTLSAPVYHPHLLDSNDAMVKGYQQQFVKMEEQNHFTADDSCNFYSVDQAPSFWYFSDPKNQ